MKKYLVSYATATINKGSRNKLQKCLKPAITFATIPRQLTRISYFFVCGTILPKNFPFCFTAWFLKFVDKTRVNFVIAHPQHCFLRYTLQRKQDAHTASGTLYKNLNFLLSSCTALAIKYFPILDQKYSCNCKTLLFN